MRIRLSLTLRVDREPKPEPEAHERTGESVDTGAIVEMSPQPRMIGFTSEEVD